jgi:AraC-like DNA-binding protein
MPKRRRIDWSVILKKQPPRPTWGASRTRSDAVDLVLTFSDLFTLNDVDALLKRAIELAIGPVGLVRAGLYLFDDQLGLMLGSWGTDLRRNVVDEHHVMFQLDEAGHRVLARAISGEAHWTVAEGCPIIVNHPTETKVVGQGWVACTPICSARRPLGMLYNDAGLTDATPEPAKQAQAAVLCAIVGLRLTALRGSGRVTYGPATRHPAVAAAVQMLKDDPSLRGGDIANKIGVSLSRLARVFKSDTGVSLVDYRNQLRLDRFLSLVDSGGSNLLEAAYTAGFGSYSQFHRVFRAMRGASPREYFSGGH